MTRFGIWAASAAMVLCGAAAQATSVTIQLDFEVDNIRLFTNPTVAIDDTIFFRMTVDPATAPIFTVDNANTKDSVYTAITEFGYGSTSVTTVDATLTFSSRSIFGFARLVTTGREQMSSDSNEVSIVLDDTDKSLFGAAQSPQDVIDFARAGNVSLLQSGSFGYYGNIGGTSIFGECSTDCTISAQLTAISVLDPVPLPASGVLLAGGVLGAGALARQRRKRAAHV